MTLRQVLGWATVAFVAWWVITEPVSAAHFVHNIGLTLDRIAKGLSVFFASL